jgi:membrane protease YdiL (CAAX protease family)
MADPYRGAARAYALYGVVYLVGGLYLLSQGVGVMGGTGSGSTTRTMVRWGLIGLIPLVAIPWLLSRRWSFLGGWASRRTFAWVVALLLAVRAFKVGELALRGGASVPAPWGGEITFQAGAALFLVVTLAALAFVLRAALSREAVA